MEAPAHFPLHTIARFVCRFAAPWRTPVTFSGGVNK